ncbi:MAG: hypothetical protein VB092_04495 [Oscillospiraceae bacterium]|nr:hypothetical protein [Oscillospiraceae bacterium]
MKKRGRAWVAALAACVLAVLPLGGCGTPATQASAAPRTQAAVSALGALASPTDESGLAALRTEIDGKLAEVESAAVQAGLADDTYYRLIRDDVVQSYLEDSIDARLGETENLSGDAKAAAISALSSNLLELWSTLDTLAAAPVGYAGLTRALCEGNDIFSMGEDATDLLKDGAWPTGYFFDDCLPPLERADAFYACDDYLSGYGMENALLYSIGVSGVTKEQALDYFNKVEDLGLFAYDVQYDVEFEEDYCAWYGCWVGDDGADCFVWISYAPADEGDEYQMIAGNRELTIVAGNFDFNLCANAALEKMFSW